MDAATGGFLRHKARELVGIVEAMVAAGPLPDRSPAAKLLIVAAEMLSRAWELEGRALDVEREGGGRLN